MARRKVNVTKLTAEEYAKVSSKKAAAPKKATKKAAPKKATTTKKPEPAQPSVPVVVNNADVAQAVSATGELARQLSEAAMAQSQQATGSLSELSAALRQMANKPSWVRIKIEVNRGRDDLIKSAELIRVE